MGSEDQYVFLTRGCNLACILSNLSARNLSPKPYCHCLDCTNWLYCPKHAYYPEQENRIACWQALDTSLPPYSVPCFSKVALVWIWSHSINVYSHCLSSPCVSLSEGLFEWTPQLICNTVLDTNFSTSSNCCFYMLQLFLHTYCMAFSHAFMYMYVMSVFLWMGFIISTCPVQL